MRFISSKYVIIIWFKNYKIINKSLSLFGTDLRPSFVDKASIASLVSSYFFKNNSNSSILNDLNSCYVCIVRIIYGGKRVINYRPDQGFVNI
jgi:hypothetical protein